MATDNPQAKIMQLLKEALDLAPAAGLYLKIKITAAKPK
jgi:hypothetical protein